MEVDPPPPPVDDYLQVKWARSFDGPVSHEVTGPVGCYDCGGRLTFVKEHERKRNGIKHVVRGHYRHVGARVSNCQPESILHKAAKHALVLHPHMWRFHFPCPDCANRIPICDVFPSTASVQEEVTWKVPGHAWRLDVAALDGAGRVVGAVEVLHTSETRGEKITDLNVHGVAWCEVKAEHVLRALEDDVAELYDLEAFRCAVGLCDTCQGRSLAEETAKLEEMERQARHELDQLVALRRKVIDVVQLYDLCVEHPMELKDAEAAKWAELTKRTCKYVLDQASELGMSCAAAQQHAERLLSGEKPLSFGKFKGMFIDQLLEDHRPYVLWLAGYEHNDGNTLPSKLAAPRPWMPASVEREALELTNGKCHFCGTPTGASWKTLCPKCYRSVVTQND